MHFKNDFIFLVLVLIVAAPILNFDYLTKILGRQIPILLPVISTDLLNQMQLRRRVG
jgi:hypothetical protein